MLNAMKKTYTLLTALLVLATQLNSQQVIQIGDTLNLNIGNTYRGNLQWQQSSDQINWTDIPGATQSNLSQAVTQMPVYYRAKATEGNCSPKYSNITLADSLLSVTPPSNYTDTARVTIYTGAAFANQTIGPLFSVAYPNNGLKLVAFGSHNAQGEPDTLAMEAKIYFPTDDTIVNLKLDSSQRVKAMYFTINGVNDTLLYSFKYFPNDSVTTKVFRVFWENDSLVLRKEAYGIKDADTIAYLGQVYFKNDNPPLHHSIPTFSAANAITLMWGGMTLYICNIALNAAPATGGSSLFACVIAATIEAAFLLADNAHAATIDTVNVAPPIYSPFKQSTAALLSKRKVFTFGASSHGSNNLGGLDPLYYINGGVAIFEKNWCGYYECRGGNYSARIDLVTYDQQGQISVHCSIQLSGMVNETYTFSHCGPTYPTYSAGLTGGGNTCGNGLPSAYIGMWISNGSQSVSAPGPTLYFPYGVDESDW